MPAPKNLTVPSYTFAGDARIVIGSDESSQDHLNAREVERWPQHLNPTGTSKGLIGWIDRRFPLTVLWRTQVAEYYAPKNFNFWYYFGSLALLVLVNQLVTGIFLTMNYKPSSAGGVRIGRVHHARRATGAG